MQDSAALHIDETPILCLKSDKTYGYMWAMSSTDTGSALYYRQNNRCALPPAPWTAERWMKNLPDAQKPQWQVCWAHARRKFVESAGNSNDSSWSMKMVELIRPLYTIKQTLRESKAPPERKLQERMKKIQPHCGNFLQGTN